MRGINSFSVLLILRPGKCSRRKLSFKVWSITTSWWRHWEFLSTPLIRPNALKFWEESTAPLNIDRGCFLLCKDFFGLRTDNCLPWSMFARISLWPSQTIVVLSLLHALWISSPTNELPSFLDNFCVQNVFQSLWISRIPDVINTVFKKIWVCLRVVCFKHAS